MRQATNSQVVSARAAGEWAAQTDLEDGLRWVPSYAASLGARTYSADVELQAEYRTAYMVRHNQLCNSGKVRTA